MKIAILGWGSLIWDPRALKTVGKKWSDGGPTLKIEFSRISSDDRLTLVIDEANGSEVKTLFIISALDDLGAAIENLRSREKTLTEKIGYIVKGRPETCAFAKTHHPNAFAAIRTWLDSIDADAVIWTALEPDFSRAGEPFSVMAAQRHFEKLTGEVKEVARTYIQKAPSVVNTPVRRLLSAHVASPISTGGAGTVLEHRFAASCVAFMLCGGEMPLIPKSKITRVSVQTGNLHWHTDDVLVEGTRSDGTNFKVAIQAKRSCAAKASNTDFADFIAGAWADFTAISRFSAANDRLALVSTYQTSALVHFRSLLERARATPDADTWAASLSVPSFLSVEVGKVRALIEKILLERFQVQPGVKQLWGFLRACAVLLVDLDVEDGGFKATIVSLLRTTCTQGNADVEAENTWNALQSLTATAEGVAKIITLSDVPSDLRQKHGGARGTDIDKLKEMLEASETVLARSRDTIQGVPIPRVSLETEASEALATRRAILVTGGAGSGKSAVAKRIYREASQDAFALAFNAEEFAAANLRASPAMHGITIAKLKELGASHTKRVVLIESLERLLEDDRRDALLDFLRELAKDPSWQVILTCRLSASVTVQLAFLAAAGLESAVVEVPPLTDAELDETAKKLPQLAYPLSSPRLRDLLRQPFLLEKAAAMSWAKSESLPTGERQFREKVWREIVRKNSVTGGGLPQRRATTFVELALKRARDLAPFILATSFDQEALQKLRDDGLISHHRKSEALVAPAHDMLEDWALLQYLDDAFLAKESKLLELVRSLEPFPALRRAYRKWLDEALESEPAISAGIFAVIADVFLPQQWRDETIITVLRSSRAAAFITANEAKLLENDGELLFRFVHLCRVAATAQSPHVPLSLGRLSFGKVPRGDGWVALAKLLQKVPQLIQKQRFTLVAKFISDWSKGIDYKNPNPPEAVTFSAIALEMLGRGESSYRLSESESALVTYLLKVPLSCKEELTKRLRADFADGRFDGNGKGFAEQALASDTCIALCRDLPDLVIETLNAYLYEKEDPDEDYRFGRRSRKVEHVFGLREFLSLDGASPSAQHGPWFYLLSFQPRKAIKLITDVMNRAADSYEQRAPHAEYIESAQRVEMEYADGTKKPVIANSRLWQIYRGSSVSPYVLQSMLMALEAWLLGIATSRPTEFPIALDMLAKSTNNAAMLGLVAGVATAHFKLAGDSAYCVLTVPGFFFFDHHRAAQESIPLENVFGGLSLDVADALDKEDRRASRTLPHRRRHLEDLCRNLQVNGQPLREKVWALLDRLRAEAGGDKPVDEDAAVWINIIHRMDLRTFEAVGKYEDKILMQPSALPAGVTEKLAPIQPGLREQELAMSLMSWGTMAFMGKLDAERLGLWREMLTKARDVPAPGPETQLSDFAQYGAGNIAAYVIREHMAELTTEEAEWCRNRVIQEIERDAGTHSDMLMMQNHDTNGDRACAFVVSKLLAASPDDAKLKQATALALTHPVKQVRIYAASGYPKYFSGDPVRLMKALSAFTAGAIKYRDLFDEEMARPFLERDTKDSLHEALTETREMLLKDTAANPSLLTKLSLWDSGRDLYFATIAVWLSRMPATKEAEEFFARISAELIAAWTKEGSDDRLDLYSDDVSNFEEALARYLLTAPESCAIAIVQKIAGVLTKESKEPAGLMLELMRWAANAESIDQFWKLWKILADQAIAIPAAHYVGRHSRHTDLLQRLYLDLLGSKKNAEEWPLITGREEKFVWLYDSLPTNSESTAFFLRYLESHGQKAMPRALTTIAKKISENSAAAHVTGANVQRIEALLANRIFGTPVYLKSDPDVRKAVITILDALVNLGSTAAFFMRDDFATPLRPDAAAS